MFSFRVISLGSRAICKSIYLEYDYILIVFGIRLKLKLTGIFTSSLSLWFVLCNSIVRSTICEILWCKLYIDEHGTPCVQDCWLTPMQKAANNWLVKFALSTSVLQWLFWERPLPLPQARNSLFKQVYHVRENSPDPFP